MKKIIKKMNTLYLHIKFIVRFSGNFHTIFTLALMLVRVVAIKTNDSNFLNKTVRIKLKLKNATKNIYIRPNDYYILYEVFGLEVYKHFLNIKNYTGTILDLGGHIGLSVIYFRQYTNEKIVAFEPSKINLELIRKNLENDQNTEIRTEAVGDMIGETSFYIYPDTPSRNSLMPEIEGRKTIEQKVTTITLDSVLEQFPECAYIKFDIEGMEYKIFAKSTYAQSVSNIIGEIRNCKDFTLNEFLNLFPNHKSEINCLDKKTFLISLSKRDEGAK